MLRLHSISLIQFKNYRNSSFEFTDRIIGICGRNGVGKTNLLDAIHYLCFTKSYFSRLDSINVEYEQQGFRISGELILSDKQEKVVCILRETGKKEFTLDDEPYERFSSHIGRYPCVMIAPDDVQIITGTSEERRKFIDTILSQLSPGYLQNLITYNRLTQQRNVLLRSFAETGTQDLALLDVIDRQLMVPGQQISEKRKEFLIGFMPMVKNLYNDISRQFEDINLFYESQLLHSSFSDLLQANRQKDLLAQRTTAGIHRDDIELQLRSQPFRNLASQGQRKSLLFAMKLAEMEVLKREKGITPLLLLDDVFEKLDDDRMNNLLQRVCSDENGQVFITDTNEQRIRDHLAELSVSCQLIHL